MIYDSRYFCLNTVFKFLAFDLNEDGKNSQKKKKGKTDVKFVVLCVNL